MAHGRENVIAVGNLPRINQRRELLLVFMELASEKEFREELDKLLLDDPEFSKVLHNCFEKLPQKWSSAVQLKFLEEHDSKTICSKLEITTSNFWQIVHRVKLQLRNCLELKWFKK